MNSDLELVAEQFRKLPGIGVKTARRLAYFMLERPKEDIDAFINVIHSARDKICYCSICCNLATSDPCEICGDNPTRFISDLCSGASSGCAGTGTEP